MRTLGIMLLLPVGLLLLLLVCELDRPVCGSGCTPSCARRHGCL